MLLRHVSVFIGAIILGLLLAACNGGSSVNSQLPATTGGEATAQLSSEQSHHHVLYRVFDLGTFGGPASFINQPYNSVPAVSNQSLTVGASDTPVSIDPTSVCNGGGYARVGDMVVPFVSHGFAARDDVVRDLGALPPSRNNCSNAVASNAGGSIIGFSEDGQIDPIAGFKEQHAVLWRGGSIEDLGTLGGRWSGASGINDRGQIVGGAVNNIADPVSLLYFVIGGLTNGTQQRAVLWENGTTHDLGTLGGPDAYAEYINERGQIAGYSYTGSKINPTTGIPTVHPFLWDHGKMTDLGTLGGTLAGLGSLDMISGLNNQGDVIGESSFRGDLGCASGGCIVDAFVWTHGRLIDLYHAPKNYDTLAWAINDKAEIAGGTLIGPTYQAFLWENGAIKALGTLGDCFSEAHAINNSGVIVGETYACDGSDLRAFRWKNGAMVDLNALIPENSPLELINAFAINSRGEIAGVAVPRGVSRSEWSAKGHAFVLEPIAGEQNGGVSNVAASVTAQQPSESDLTRMLQRIRRAHSLRNAMRRTDHFWP